MDRHHMQPTTSLQSFKTRFFLRPQLSRKDLDRKIFQVCDLRLWGLQPWVETLKNIDIIVEKNKSVRILLCIFLQQFISFPL